MKKLNFLSTIGGTAMGLQSSDTGYRCRVVTDSLPSFCRVNVLRFISVLVLILTIGVGQMWGAYSYAGTGTFTKQTSIDGNGYYVIVLTSSGAMTSSASSNYVGVNTSYNGSASSISNPATSIVLQVTNYDSTNKKYYISNSSGNYLYSSGDKKIAYSATSQYWEIATVSSKARLKTAQTTVVYMGYVSGSGFRPYTNSGTNVQSVSAIYKLAAATPTVTPDPTSLSWGTVLQGSSQSTKTITITGANLTAGTLTISATGGYSVTPTSKGVSGTLSATTLTVTPPSTATAGTKNGKVTISGGGLASSVEVNLSMTVQASHTVTWMVNGSEYATTVVANGGNPVFPSSPTSCDADKVFVGWTETNIGSTETNTAPSFITTATTISSAKTYYAVFAKRGAFTRVTSPSSLALGQELVIVSNKYNTAITTGIGYATAPTESSSKVTPSEAMIWLLTGNSSDGWRISKPSNGYVLGASSSPSSNNSTTATLTSNNTYSTWGIGQNSYTSNVLYISYKTTVSCALEASSTSSNWVVYNSSSYSSNQYCALRVYASSLTKYVTECCTPLGSVSGTVSCTSGTAATLSWDAVTGAESYKVKVPGSSNCVDWTTATSPFSVTGLTAGQNYTAYFKAFDSNGSHCTEGPESTTAFTTPQITVTGAPEAMSYAEGEGPSSTESFVVKGKGLCGANSGQLTVTAPTNFEVSLDNSNWGDSKTITKANAESNSGQTVYVRLKKDLLHANSPFGPSNVVISGGNAASVNVSVSGTVSSACSAPTVATPTCTSVADGTITVSCAYITVDENCDVDEYGFVWKASSEPTIDDHKNAIDGDYAANFSKALTIADFTTGTTYYIKAFGHNAADYALSSALTVIPRKVTFNKNSHGSQDAPATQYMVDGGKALEPSALTDPNYTFGGWYKEAGCSNAWDFANDVVSDGDQELYAKWTPKDYTITTTLNNVNISAAIASPYTYTGSAAGISRTFSVDADNFFMPEDIVVTMGDATLVKNTGYTYDSSNGAFELTATITGNVTITATATAKLKSIAITDQPTIRKYLVGDVFSSTGSTVTATMGDGSTKTVSATWTPSTALSAGESQTVTASYTEAGINKTITTTIDVYSVTVNKVDMNGDDIDDANVTATCSGRTLSQNVGSTKYKFNSWEVSEGGVSISTNTITDAPSGDVVINAKFHKPIAIAWKVGTGDAPASEQTLQIPYGTQMKNLILPSNPADNALASCGTNKFMGWSANEVKGTGQSAPADLFTAASGTTEITSDKTFYAVFANASSSGSADDYILVESELSDWSGTYLLVNYSNNEYAMSSDVTSGKFGAVSVSPTNKVINCTNDKLIWTITQGTGDNDSKYSVKSKKTNTYANSGSTSTSASLSNSAVYLTIDYTNSNGIRIKGSSGRWFSYYNEDFRTYNQSSNNGFYLYKKNEVTYSDYQTSCCSTLGAVSNVSVVPSRTSATVSWDKLTNASGYEYKLGDAEWATASVADANNPSISLSTLSGATSYAIQIRATGDGSTYCDKGTASAVTNFKTLSRVTAAVNDGARGTAKVSLTSGSGWTDYVDAADGTTIYLQATPSSASWILGSWGASNGTVASSQLTEWTGDVIVTANFAAAELPTLATPTGMSSSDVTAISATISWNAVANASSYAISCTPSATQGDVTESAGVCSCTLTGLSAGTEYTWNVQAVGDNISYKSGVACADQNFTTVAKQPTAVAVTTAPGKTSYLEGESFDATGMVVRVTYNTEEVDDDADNYTVTPSGALEYGTTNVTITVNGSSISTTQAITVVKKYTLTLKNNGVQVGEVRDLYEGAEYGTLPTLTAGDACDATSTTFMGWTTERILEKQADAPASYASATSVMGTADVVLNAVWAKTKTPGVEPTSITSFAAGDYYLIDKQGSNYYAMSGTGTSKVNGVDVTDYVSYNSTTKQITITDESQMTAAMKYTISGTTSAAKIYNANTTAWVSTQSSGTSFSTSEGSNVVTKHSTDPRFAFSYTTMGTSGNRCILYRSTQSGFLNYAATNMDASGYASGYLWLVTVGTEAVYEDYITSCCTDWSASAPAISYSTPDHWKAGDDDVAVSIAEGTTHGEVSFESSDEAVLTVDAETGKITAVAMGTATVTATWAGGVELGTRYCSASSSVEVSVSGTVTVSFDGSGATNGTMTDQVIYYNEATALKANAFSKDGYTFYGWAETEEKAEAGNRDYEGGETVTFTTDKTLYAVWQASVHNLTLTQPTVSAVAAGTITANGSTTSPASMAYGATVTLAASENSTALDGYVFENWSVTGVTLADATANPAVFTMPDNNVAVAAVYHHYTWDLTGHEVTTAPETVYSVGDQFDKSSVVIKASYERSDNSSTKLATLETAAWTAKLDGSAIADNYTFALADNGKTLTLWVGESQVGSDYVLTVNTIPTDHFVINIWTSEVSPIADKTSAYSMPSIDDPDAGDAATCKDHNLFVGWVEETYKDEPEGHIVAANTAMTPSNKTYYAVWGKAGTITESISYGWETGESTTEWMINGTTVATPVHTGEKAGQFGTAGRAIKTSTNYANPKSITVYYTKNSNNKNESNYFKIQYSNGSSDDGTWNDIVSGKNFNQISNGNYEELTANLSSSTYEGKYFRVCFNGATTSGNLDDITLNYDISGAVDYITDCVQRYQITFDANGGTGSYDAIEKKEGATVTLPDGSALSRAAEHYHFNGWKVYNASTEAEISVSENQFTMPGANVNAVAQWEEDPKGTIRYVGDEIQNSSVTRYAGQTYDLRTEVTLPAGRKLVGWMLEGDETLYAPGRTMTMPNPVQDYTYHVQIIDQLPKPSGVSFSGGEWVLVTNSDQLNAGDFVVIVANETTNAMGAQANTNRGVASVTKHNEGQTITLSSGVATLFLQYGYKEGEFALYDLRESGYLYANSNTANQLKTNAEYSTRNYSWKITIGNGNIASIVAQGANTHNNLQYNPNSGSPLFSCYTGGQTAVQLYRYEGIQTVTITEEVNASEIHLANADVIVTNNGSLVVDANKTLHDVTIQSTSGAMGVDGTSGQLTGNGTLTINGNLFLEIQLRSDAMDAEASQKWYCISAPFDVDINNGFYWGNGTHMVHNVDFQIFEWDGDRRATGASGWRRTGGTMKAGVAYFIGFDDARANQNTIKLKAKNNTISNVGVINAPAHSGSAEAETYGNWNGLGNPNFHHIALDQNVQAFDYNEQSYNPYTTGDYNFVVGTPFFIQYAGNIGIEAADNAYYRAPKREGENYSYCVRIGKADASHADNQIFVRASETASAEFDDERDMITMNGTTSNYGALLWTKNYGDKRLAIEEAPMVNNKASYELGIFAPTAGTYSISVAAPQENAELYLTKNGHIIWNLTMSPCELELTQGKNNEYGLMLRANVPSVSTDVEGIQPSADSIQKVIIDEKVFILRGGKMYDVTGKEVR